MTVTKDKIADTVALRLGAARHHIDALVMPVMPAGKMAAKLAARQAAHGASRQMKLAQLVMKERIVPMAVGVVGTAMVRSAPFRNEAVHRTKLAAAALREGDAAVMKKSRRWPVAIGSLALGGAIGAAAAWLSQAGKPVQLTPYPLPTDEERRINEV
jgi:hypothetical protein